MKKFLKILRVTLKTLIIAIIAGIALITGFFIFITARDFQPEPVSDLEIVKPGARSIIIGDEFSLLTWNIGYCALGTDMDFFYDGGRQVRPSDENYQKYLNGVYNVLARYDSVDFIMLQEVDKNSRRSFSTDQVDILRKGIPAYGYTYACNYKVDFVPLPIASPMGSVESGLLTFSRYLPVSAQR